MTTDGMATDGVTADSVTADNIATDEIITDKTTTDDITAEINELLPESAEGAQIWVIGSRKQVLQTINELHAKQITEEPLEFSPIVPTTLEAGKYISISAKQKQ